MSYKYPAKTLHEFPHINEKNLKLIRNTQKVYSKLKETFYLRPSDIDIVNLKIKSPEGKINVRLYYPKKAYENSNNGCILFMHGGGFVMGNLDTHEGLCLKLARETNRVVISVDYRLAPKHIYPAAIRDSYCVYYYICKHHRALKIDTGNIVLCGTSAGGNLALAVMEMCLRKTRGVRPKAMVLMYPVTDIESLLMEEYMPSIFENAEEPNLSPHQMLAMLRYYIPYFEKSSGDKSPDFLGNPYISPVKSELMFQYPRTIVISAGKDILRDENRAFVNMLAQNSIELEHHEFSNMPHAFMTFESKNTERAIKLIAEFLS